MEKIKTDFQLQERDCVKVLVVMKAQFSVMYDHWRLIGLLLTYTL